MSKSIAFEILDYVKIIIIALIITNLINVGVFTLSQVRQHSMEYTLMEKDQLIVEKLSYTFGNPKEGDIIVFIKGEKVDDGFIAKMMRLYEDMVDKFKKEENRVRLVKRVIGLPGDVIDIHEGSVFVNGKALVENYTHDVTINGQVQYPLTVPENQYFVMGDNRIASLDSREFGTIPGENIEGKVVMRLWPFAKIGTVH